jgi:xanthine dehydrogenase molybdenum-binding subunit
LPPPTRPSRLVSIGPKYLVLARRYFLPWPGGQIRICWKYGKLEKDNSILLSIPLALGIQQAQIIKHSPYAGGQFGNWELGFGPQMAQVAIAALISKKTGLPVKVVNRREDEHFGEMDNGTYNCKVGFKKDGTITAVQVETLIAQMSDIGFVPDTIGTGHLAEGTKIPNIQCTGTAVFVNRQLDGPSRCEQQTDAHVKENIFSRVAAALGTDEGTIALQNDGCQGNDMTWVSQFKQANQIPDIDSLSVVLQAGKTAINWSSKFHAPGALTLPNGNLHGMAMAPNHEFQNGGPPYNVFGMALPCHLTVDSGKIFMVAQRPDCGLDGRTNYSRSIAEETGMNLADVIYPRSQEEPSSEPQTAFIGGGGSVCFTIQSWVTVATARLLKQKMLGTASAALSIPVTDLDIQNSMLIQISNPSNSTPVAALSFLEGIVATSRETYADWASLNMPAPPPSCHFIARSVNLVEVEVDPGTGGVQVTNAVAVNDVGLATSPEGVLGQQYGGAIYGYSTSACEEIVYDSTTGVILNPNCLDYKIFTILDAPPVTPITVESRMGYAPYGMGGVGEDNCTFCSPLLLPAIYNATGVWLDEYPMTPDRILKALGKG